MEVAGVAALLFQLETPQALPNTSLTLVSEVAGYQRTLTCRSNAWDGYDLTHQFMDERSIAIIGPSQGTKFEQEASLRKMPVTTTPQLPPQIVSYQPPVSKPTPMTPTYDRSPAFGIQRGGQTIMQTTSSNAPRPDREPSGSRLPPLPNPDLAGRNPSEQAVIVALQAVASYPAPTDFVQAVQQRLPGVAAYLQAAAQPSGCAPQVPLIETSPMEAEAVASTSAERPPGTTSPHDEIGRKRTPHETAASTSREEITSPTSGPPPDKQRSAQPKPKSVEIAQPTFRVDHQGVGAPQMSMEQAMRNMELGKLATVRALCPRAQQHRQQR